MSNNSLVLSNERVTESRWLTHSSYTIGWSTIYQTVLAPI